MAEKCTICHARVKDPAKTPCDHVFCTACIARWISHGRLSCPLCDRPVNLEELSPVIPPLNFASEENVGSTPRAARALARDQNKRTASGFEKVRHSRLRGKFDKIVRREQNRLQPRDAMSAHFPGVHYRTFPSIQSSVDESDVGRYFREATITLDNGSSILALTIYSAILKIKQTANLVTVLNGIVTMLLIIPILALRQYSTRRCLDHTASQSLTFVLHPHWSDPCWWAITFSSELGITSALILGVIFHVWARMYLTRSIYKAFERFQSPA